MPDQLTLSPSAWTLLDLLQQQMGVTVEVLDVARRPIAPPGTAEHGSVVDDPSIAAEVLKSIRSGELRVDRSTGAPVGIFPLRLARQVVGCLLVTGRPSPEAERRDQGEANVESAGHVARAALEADLTLTSQLTEARYRTRRVHGILRFLTQVGGAEGEREVMHAVIQAATVWFDIDCRIYHRDPDGSYVLAAALPGVDARTAPPLDAGRATKLLAARRLPAGGDLEDVLSAGRQQEVLVLGVGTAPAAPWLLLLAGTIDPEVDLAFTAIARVLEGHLLARDAARFASWQQRLSQLSIEGRPAPERVLLRMLEALVERTGAGSASLVLAAQARERVLAALGGAAAPDAGPEADQPRPPAAERQVVVTAPVASGAEVRLTLAPLADLHDAARQAESWMAAIRPWLHQAAATLEERDTLFQQAIEGPPFERRIQEEVERARRFNLGLGLVVIAPAGGSAAALRELIEHVRTELRASDLVGRIRSGQLAVLLVHAEAMSADSVMARIRRRLRQLAEDRPPLPVHVGRAMFSAECATAEALIHQARQAADRSETLN